MTKHESLSELDTDYLKKLCSQLNHSRRDYSTLSREEVLQRAASKLTVDEVDIVTQRFAREDPPAKVAELLTPPSAREIRTAVEDYFGDQGLYEVKIGQRRCDIVFPDEIIAVEIKSARDRIDRAESQLAQYKRWADNVFLAYDQCHEERLPAPIVNDGVGLLKFSDGRIAHEKDPVETELAPRDRLSWMTYDTVATYSRQHGLCSEGTKEELVERLSDVVSDSESRAIFGDYLRSRV